ncbi:MAG: hypothetical protein AAFP70_15255, partial [Calditrichota bacterium]
MSALYRVCFIVLFSFFGITQLSAQSAKAVGELLELQPNGTFATTANNEARSANGEWRATYELASSDILMRRDGHGGRAIQNLHVFQNGSLAHSISEPKAADLYISNSGMLALMEVEIHNVDGAKVHFVSQTGATLHRVAFKRASGFAFSTDGNSFGVNAGCRLHLR